MIMGGSTKGVAVNDDMHSVPSIEYVLSFLMDTGVIVHMDLTNFQILATTTRRNCQLFVPERNNAL